jgi:Na+/proline symporter
VADVKNSVYKDSAAQLQRVYDSINTIKQQKALAFTQAMRSENHAATQILTEELKSINAVSDAYRKKFSNWVKKINPSDTNDTNYIFLSFAKQHLPAGLRGLLIAIIFLAAWGSIAAALNSLAASTVIDFHQRFTKPNTPANEYVISKWYTFGWGLFCILAAQFANRLGNSLIEAVNILGSLFYGVILGIFLLAFYVKKVGGSAAFFAAIITEAFIIMLFFKDQIPALHFLPNIHFLWLTAIGAITVVLIGLLLQGILKRRV